MCSWSCFPTAHKNNLSQPKQRHPAGSLGNVSQLENLESYSVHSLRMSDDPYDNFKLSTGFFQTNIHDQQHLLISRQQETKECLLTTMSADSLRPPGLEVEQVRSVLYLLNRPLCTANTNLAFDILKLGNLGLKALQIHDSLSNAVYYHNSSLILTYILCTYQKMPITIF